MYGADGRMGADDAIGRTSGQADGAERPRTVGRTRAERVRTVEWTGGRGPARADGWMYEQAVGRMGGLGGRGGRGTDGGLEGQADGRTGRSGGLRGRGGEESAGWADGRTEADRRTSSLPVGRTSGRADERVGLGLKGHIPRGPLHSWAPSPLASSEREHAGCLGV